MADVQPLRALHYDPAVVGRAGERGGTALRRDRRGQRAALLARSPFNVVAVDLPQGGRAGPVRRGGRAVRRAGSRRARWCATRSRRCGRTRRTTRDPTGQRRTRRGFFCRVRIEDYGPGRVRPHERTHPGPEGGPAAPDARHAGEHLTDLLAVLRPGRRRLGGARAGDRADAVGRHHGRRRHGAPPLARRRSGRRSPPYRLRRATRSC